MTVFLFNSPRPDSYRDAQRDIVKTEFEKHFLLVGYY